LHSRYAQLEITEIFGDKAKTALWDDTELAVIRALQNAGIVPDKTYESIRLVFDANPVDLAWWKERDRIIKHDLNAYLEERRRHIPEAMHQYFHAGLTSYDTEEPAFAQTLNKAVEQVRATLNPLFEALKRLVGDHRKTIMVGRTHGQTADLQTLGKRFLIWYGDLVTAKDILVRAREVDLKYSKLSGAIGNYNSVSPEIERAALAYLGLQPYVGATQIMPRVMYLPLASALVGIVTLISKIADDIRLGARGPRPIYQEPFGKMQKGSSAMPHKKNTIKTEQLVGMARMAKGYLGMITDNISTWEERAIEQSCVERVAWPDLFHVTVHSIRTLTGVLNGLVVYPQNLLWEVVETRGTYAASKAKEVLKLWSKGRLTSEDCYRIVQLASFNAFE
jgi:adenylosuccinate lyase